MSFFKKKSLLDRIYTTLRLIIILLYIGISSFIHMLYADEHPAVLRVGDISNDFQESLPDMKTCDYHVLITAMAYLNESEFSKRQISLFCSALAIESKEDKKKAFSNMLFDEKWRTANWPRKKDKVEISDYTQKIFLLTWAILDQESNDSHTVFSKKLSEIFTSKTITLTEAQSFKNSLKSPKWWLNLTDNMWTRFKNFEGFEKVKCNGDYLKFNDQLIFHDNLLKETTIEYVFTETVDRTETLHQLLTTLDQLCLATENKALLLEVLLKSVTATLKEEKSGTTYLTENADILEGAMKRATHTKLFAIAASLYTDGDFNAYENRRVGISGQDPYLVAETDHKNSFIFTIPDFRTLNTRIKEGTMTNFICSPVYKTNKGYYVALRAYPRGDGRGKSTHFSLYFTVVKGNNDDNLNWPFAEKITLMILPPETPSYSTLVVKYQGEQTDASIKQADVVHKISRTAVMEKFRPDPCSDSFMQPSIYENIAAGCPQLCTQEKLYQMVHSDDSLQIKCILGD